MNIWKIIWLKLGPFACSLQDHLQFNSGNFTFLSSSPMFDTNREQFGLSASHDIPRQRSRNHRHVCWTDHHEAESYFHLVSDLNKWRLRGDWSSNSIIRTLRNLTYKRPVSRNMSLQPPSPIRKYQIRSEVTIIL
jgi:hypothetical protein